MYNVSLILLDFLVELEVIFIFTYLFSYFTNIYNDSVLNLYYSKYFKWPRRT